MPTIQLPHTLGCLVCGRDNAHGLRLDLHVDPTAGIVHTTFTPGPQHIGFQGIIHGGVLATVLDEAMVWCATWAARRFCVCAEMTVRYLHSAAVGEPLAVEAKVTSDRPRLITAEGSIFDSSGRLIATAAGKYTRLSPERNRHFLATLTPEAATHAAGQYLRTREAQGKSE
jgi:uncharacterized protein (TIGR00369 family)